MKKLVSRLLFVVLLVVTLSLGMISFADNENPGPKSVIVLPATNVTD